MSPRLAPPARRRVRLALGLAVCATLAPPLAGSEIDGPLERFVRQAWTARDGLPQSTVNALAQSAEGYLWIGTDGGLARFDGEVFRTFGPASEPPLPAARILSLAVDRQGVLWIGTAINGLLHSDDQGFARSPTPIEGITPIRVLLADRTGAVWAGTDQGVLRRSGGNWRRFGLAEGLPSLTARALAEDGSGRIWAATDRGSAWFDGQRFHLGGAAGPVRALSRGAQGNVFALTGKPEILALGVMESSALVRPDALAGVSPNTLLGTADGALWFAGDGIGRWAEGRIRLAPSEAAVVRRPVRALFEDHDRNLWVGTDGAGLLRMAPGAARTLGRSQGLAADAVLPVTETADGSIWIGARCGGLWRYRWGGFEEAGLPEGGRFRCVNSLLVDRRGTLWVGHDGGLTRLGAGIERSFGRRDGLPTFDVRALLEDRDGQIWAWTTGGPARLTGDRLTAIPLPAELAGETPLVLFAARDGAIWAGLESGVAVQRDGRWARPNAAEGVDGLPVRDFLEDTRGVLWAAVYGAGLARFDGQRWTHIGAREGLPNPFLSRLLDDGRGNLWVTSSAGVHRFAWADVEAVVAGQRSALSHWTVGVEEGLRSAECVGGGSPAGWLARDGRLWIPTVAGLGVIDPRRRGPSADPPVAILEQVRVDGSPRPVEGTAWIETAAESVEFQYTSVLFAERPTLRFRFQLAGFDRQWRDAGGRRTAIYSRLPPGSFRFAVQAARGDGPWGEAASIALEVTPLWYETPRFRGAALLVPALLGVLLVTVRARRLRYQRAQLSRLVEERTAELAAAKAKSDEQVERLARQEHALENLNRDLERRVTEQTEQLRDTRDMAIYTLARIAELRDGSTGEHLERIAAFSRRLAEALAAERGDRLGADFADRVFRASPLHDIGKVAIADSILRKTGPLTAEERRIMEEHTTIGGDTLRRIVERYERHDFLTMGMEIAYAHHERWDGRGYPGGLAGEAIPLAARLVAVVDAYDAITSERPYKPALSHDVALGRMAEDRGTHFDPDLLDLFVGVSAEIAALAVRLRAAG